jgi:hypothetical protein
MLSVFPAFLAGCLTAAPATARPSVDPAVQGEWLAFADINLTTLESAEARRAAANLLQSGLPVLWSSLGPVTLSDREVLAKSTTAAAEGKLVSVWVVPAVADGQLTTRIAARVRQSAGEASHDVGPPLDPTSTPLRTHSPMLGRDGFMEWPAHRAAAVAKDADQITMLELAFNIDAIRHAVGAEFAAGPQPMRGPALLGRLKVGNARVLGLHIRLIPAASVFTRDPSLPRRVVSQAPSYVGPPLAVLRATWSSRADPPGEIRAADLTSGYWPLSQLPLPSDPDAALVIAGRVAWRTLIADALDLYESTLPAAKMPAFVEDRRNWSATQKQSLTSLFGGLEPWIVLDIPTQPGLGAVRLQAPLRSDTSAEKAKDPLGQSTAILAPAVNDPASEWSSNAANRWSDVLLVWRVRADKPAAVELRIQLPPP